MRNPLLLATALLLFACGDIAPTEQVDLCKGDAPPSNTCDQCKNPPFAKGCPKCRHSPPERGCENASSVGSGGASGGDGGQGGGSGGTSGSGGNAGSSGMGGQGGGGGGTVAMMDAGPDAAVDGGPTCSGCKAGWKFCVGTECAQCLKESDCGGTLHCDKLGSHACVQCINDKQCEAQGMVCDEDKRTCVPCVVDGDCKDPKLAQCAANNVCVPCSDDGACEGREGLSHCDKGTNSALKGQCVQCLAHGDCKNPEPQCNSKRECEGCSKTDEACVGKDGTTVCDEDKWSDTLGQCVECTGTKYAACKDGSTEYVCDSAKRMCSESGHTKGATANCIPCISDAECLFGSACVKQHYGGRDFGPYCFPANDGSGCASMMNPNLRPYSQPKDTTSIDHQGESYCLPLTTCQAFLDATGAKPDGCLNNNSPDATLCGLEGIDDGYCIGTGSAKGMCSYVCQNDSDCPTVGLTACGTGFVCQP